MKTYAVTGEHHGSIVEAKSKKEARMIFRAYYNGEKVLLVKDISTYNLANL